MGTPPKAGLIFDASGNLYGTTWVGGSHSDGTVFELTPGTNGRWKEKVLHSFNGKDGEAISAGLISAAAGNLYGTASLGGDSGYGCNTYGCGTVFVLKPGAYGKWTEKVLHRFNNTFNGGNFPVTELVFDPAGNLYGTTVGGAQFARATAEPSSRSRRNQSSKSSRPRPRVITVAKSQLHSLTGL